SHLNTGGRYNPAANSWTAVSTTSAPSQRYIHTAVWTGSEMIIWGGRNLPYVNDGARYSPSANSWTAVSTNGAPAVRGQHTAVWTAGAPSQRSIHTAVWTGSEMIFSARYRASHLSAGGRYNPAANSWTAATTTGAPAARYNHTAVWTGSEMIVWGGSNISSNY